MAKSTEVSTACLDVTLQVNAAWVKQSPRHSARHRSRDSAMQPSSGMGHAAGVVDAGEEETMLLCSDIISVDEQLRSQPDFDTTAYVMSQAIAHTHRFCSDQGAKIRAFRSVEVLRMVQAGMAASFLFVFEAILAD